tara:strand:+ start:6273 stop:7877 length:1605 start_codon:yes stop_codon:yes gene_type:complete
VRVTGDGVRWLCHHCGENGGCDRLEKSRVTAEIKKFIPPAQKIEISAIDYLKSRGLSEEVISSGRVVSSTKWLRKANAEVPVVGFPYVDPQTDNVYAVKYRGIDIKDHIQEGSAISFYGIERIVDDEPIVIVEGEIDCLSAREAGVKNSVSVPNGAPVKVSDGLVDPSEDRKFNYVWQANDKLKAAEKIIIAVDGDAPGKALAEELARRIGKSKCWTVSFPDDCKDANDVLLKHGKAELRNMIDAATPWPIAGLYDADHYADAVKHLYQNGAGKGLTTGFANVDELFTIKSGMVHIVTGVPSMGKSEFVDQILYNLAATYDWKHAICSFENPPHMHIAKFLEKRLRKPFHTGPTPRMTEDEVDTSMGWLRERFIFMEQSDGTSATIDDILERASAAVARMGVRTLTIDPYNYMEMGLGSKSETNLISEMLTKVRNWAAAHDVAVFFVAHPSKLYRQNDGNYPVPKGYDISSSASWFAKADVGITVHRNFDRETVEVHVWKVRFKHLGKQGVAELTYDVTTGTYKPVKEDWEVDF